MIKKALNLFGLLMLLPISASGINTLGNYVNPVIKSIFPDPTVIRAQDGAFYTASTAGLTPVYKSYNLCDWTYVGNAFTDETKPSYGHIGIDGDTWAPDFNYINGKYVMYYSVSKNDLWACGIGVAWSEKPEGPYHDAKRLFTSSEIGVQNSIDPCYFEDNGKKYLFWGSFYGIYAIELSDDGLSIKPGAQKVAIADTNFEDRNNGVEGIMVHKRGKYYYIIGSQGWCCGDEKSTYKLRVARSTNVLGPYYDINGNSAKDHKMNVILISNDAVKGPGHCSEIITDDEGQDWILYHGFEVSNIAAKRQLFLDKVNWSSDGWPTVHTGSPSTGEVMKPYFRPACSSMTEKWNYSEQRNTKTQKGWDASKVRNFCYNDGKLYCVYENNAIKVINAQTGEDLGNLNEGNICKGGTLKFCDVKYFDGHIVACNLALASKGEEFRVYCWDGDNQNPYLLMSTTDLTGCERMGDCLEIAPGSDWYSNLWFCCANQNGNTTNIIEFCRNSQGWSKHVYPVTTDGTAQFKTGSTTRAYQKSGTWWIDGSDCAPTYFGRTNGVLIKQLDVPTNPTWGSSHHEFRFRGQKIAANLLFNAPVTGDNTSTLKGARMRLVVDRVGKYSKVYPAGEFPSDGLGSTTRNTNVTGDIAINTDGENYVEAWVCSTGHGMAYFVFGNPPTKNPSPISQKPASTEEPELYFCGTKYSNWQHLDEYKMTGAGGIYSIHVPFIEGEFKIINTDCSEEWSYPQGKDHSQLMELNTTYYVSNNIGGGSNNCNNSQLSIPAMDCTVTYNRNVNTLKITGISVPGIYFVDAQYTGWTPGVEDYKFTHQGSGIFQLHMDKLPGGDEFKINTGKWTSDGGADFSANRKDLEMGKSYDCRCNSVPGENMSSPIDLSDVILIFDAGKYKLTLASGQTDSVSINELLNNATVIGVYDLLGRRIASGLAEIEDSHGIFIIVTNKGQYKLMK